MKGLKAVLFAAVMIALAPGAAWAGDGAADLKAVHAKFEQQLAAGAIEGAIPFAETALELGGKVHGPESREAGILALSLGDLYVAVRDYAKARGVLARTMAIREEIYGENAPQLIRPLSQLGHVHVGQHDLDAAKDAFRRALAIAKKSAGPATLVTADILLALGQTEYVSAEPKRARHHLLRGIRIYKDRSATTDPNYGSALLSLAKLMRSSGTRLGYQLQGLSVLEAALPPGDGDILLAHAAIVSTYEEMGKRDDATKHVLYLARHQGKIEDIPMPFYRVAPFYPSRAAKAGRGGYVDLHFTITANGMVKDATAVGGQNLSTFRRAAIDSIEKWRYMPKIVDGEPVEQKDVEVRIEFKVTR